MKKILTIITLISFLSVFNKLSAFAYESPNKHAESVIYTLDKDVFNNSNEFKSFSNVTNNISNFSESGNNDWAWSFLYPGIGQFAQKEYLSGIGYSFFASILPLTILYTIFVPEIRFTFEGPKDNASLETKIFLVPVLYIYSIIYLSSLINSIEISEKNLPQLQQDNYFWMMSLLIPGSGQIYNQSYLKGSLFILLEGLLLVPTIYIFNTNAPFKEIALLPFLVHIWNIFDSYKTVSSNKVELKKDFAEEQLIVDNFRNNFEKFSFKSDSIQIKIVSF